MSNNLTSMARALRDEDDEPPQKQPPQRSRQASFDGTVVVSVIYGLLAALAMVVVNPERTRDESVPCPVQNMQHVAVVAAAVFAVTYVVISSAE